MLVVGGIIFLSALAFEVINIATNVAGFESFFGGIKFLGISWAIWATIAFEAADVGCLCYSWDRKFDFRTHPEAGFALTAHFFAGFADAGLSYFAFMMAIGNSVSQMANVVGEKAILTWAPVFLALMIWVIRTLLMGTIVTQGRNIFSQQ